MTSTPELPDAELPDTRLPDARLIEAHDLARAALREVTPDATIGDPAGYLDEGDGVVSLRFANRLAGYPGWFWTVSLAVVEGSEPTVLEVELLPGEDALLAPEWVPWAVRLAEYQAAQAALAAEAETDDAADDEDDTDDEFDDDETDDDFDEDDSDEDEDEDEDDDELDSDGSPILHAGDLDGVDIDELDPDEDDDSAASDSDADADDPDEDDDPDPED